MATFHHQICPRVFLCERFPSTSAIKGRSILLYCMLPSTTHRFWTSNYVHAHIDYCPYKGSHGSWAAVLQLPKNEEKEQELKERGYFVHTYKFSLSSFPDMEMNP